MTSKENDSEAPSPTGSRTRWSTALMLGMIWAALTLGMRAIWVEPVRFVDVVIYGVGGLLFATIWLWFMRLGEASKRKRQLRSNT
ncbi:hypothetical protein GCM10027403_16270 [Arthrobacter tecti]